MGGGLESPVRLIDAAGQDMRLLFGEEKFSESDLQELPDSLRELVRELRDYCLSAEIVLFLINLKDFAGQADPSRRTDNEAAIKSAMDHLSTHGINRRSCIVFTQVDLYRRTAQKYGGWRKLAEKAIPNVYGAHIYSRTIPIFAVSAVNRTRIVVDEQGIPRRVPDPPFDSDGLPDVVEWMISQIRDLHRPEATPAAPPPLPPPPLPGPVDGIKKWLRENRFNMVAGMMCLAILRSCSGGCTPTRPVRPTVPHPIVTEAKWLKNRGVFDDTVTSYGTVWNSGAAGNVVITSWVIENGREVDRRSQTMFLDAGQRSAFRIELSGIYDVDNPHEISNHGQRPWY
jgi:hypothetical protein